MPRNLAILLFDEVEVLDFAGPFEVFAVTRDYGDESTPLFNVYTVAEENRPIIARNGLSVNPAYTLADAPTPDIFLIPGGNGRRVAMHNPVLLDWIRANAQTAEQVLSVCTGAFLLGNAGLLDGEGMKATTYHTALEELQTTFPALTVVRDQRFVDNGKIVTSAGISAGIDMALYIVAKLHGIAQARWTAAHMEYAWDEKASTHDLSEA